MRIFQINGGVFGSTGKIMFSVAKLARSEGMEVVCCSPITVTNKDKEPEESYIKIGSYNSRRICRLLDIVTGHEGHSAFFVTLRLISQIKRFAPDIIHLHNIHGSYINLPLLFNHIKKNNIKTVWTLHDCWSFTGHCPHFDMIGCDKWQSGCHNCALYKDYPESSYDNSALMYRKKKKWYKDLSRLTLVTPSCWLAEKVKQSFMSEHDVKVINNGIDLDIFKPTASNFKEKYDCEDKFVVLGVAFGWNDKKGLDVLCELAHCLDDRYRIVLVGTDEETDKKLPQNVISIHRTQDQKELAQIYTAADLMVNTTREDTFPTVNIESLACGTPVVTFETGGSPEILDDTCGSVVSRDDIDSLVLEIKRICEEKPYAADACVLRAKRFDRNDKFKEYIDLYRSIQ